MKVAYSGNLLDLMEGYFRIMEEALPDWRLMGHGGDALFVQVTKPACQQAGSTTS